ncbi:hypothetical protein SFMTTN_0879 [Sulfuriferula multivorans]|uniref:Uncharacterized protein n=1 Tax=Sulfuriferula multivorans TaxID=1559896 RepID=A0A401JBL3_9PROT|nr:LPD7 domain-containing protein [Sulfuriferula multivorans]GBL45075.1 hypothetical protein SFMTTN_0879 [Sulfuriferula multivorans]
MLIRIRGGNDGVKAYLENGQKNGRQFNRDELDERVVLAGDLEICDAVIQSITSKANRYDHITLAFKEDFIETSALRLITEEFRQFAFAAHGDDEYSFYAEAHNPKIKSYADLATGKRVERKPHIHIVIPSRNLLTGQSLRYFGQDKTIEAFIDALQEHINRKYGLASPKDHRRLKITDASEMISRYKGDEFKGANRQLKEQLLNAMVDHDIVTFAGFHELLNQHGAVVVRKGRDGDYLNVTLPDANKGINLKESVFSREFIELPTSEKLQRLNQTTPLRYESGPAGRRSDDAIQAKLAVWHDTKARQIKYLHSAGKIYKQEYQPADWATCRAILSREEAAFNHKHRQENHERPDAGALIARIGKNLDAAERHIGAARASLGTLGSIEHARGFLAARTALRAVAAGEPGYDRDQVAGQQRVRFQVIRRRADNMIGQLCTEPLARQQISKAAELAEFKKIRTHLEAHRLLDYLSKTHGLMPEKYDITQGPDGSPRIRCGHRHLNVSDFLTREMNLPWHEAAPILRECYAAQRAKMRNEPARPADNSSKHLWQAFQEWKREVHAPQAKNAWQRQQQSERERRAVIKADWQRDSSGIHADHTLFTAQRRAALSVARMARAVAEQKLRGQIAIERADHRQKYPKRHYDLYPQFLVTCAEQGDEQALAELRRKYVEALPEGDYIQPAATHEATRHTVLQSLSYRIHRNGDVTYTLKGQAALTDTGQVVKVLQSTDRDVIETALRLAQAKFGEKLSIHGSAEFKLRVVEIAVQKNMRVVFVDPVLEAHRLRLVSERMAVWATMKHRPQHQPTTQHPKPPAPRVQSTQEAPVALAVEQFHTTALIATFANKPARANGRYLGPIKREDAYYLYQDVGMGELVRHAKADLAKNNRGLPKNGTDVDIRYDASRHVQQVRELQRSRGIRR